MTATTIARQPSAPRFGGASNASKTLPDIHRVFSNLKTWFNGTDHRIGSKHLPHYLNGFVFRFNRRNSPMSAFQSLLGLTAQHQSTTYQMSYAAELTG